MYFGNLSNAMVPIWSSGGINLDHACFLTICIAREFKNRDQQYLREGKASLGEKHGADTNGATGIILL